jgi:hypothetical protein
MRTPEQALAAARRTSTYQVGMCLHAVQTWFDAPHKYPDAISQARALHLYGGTPPPGVPVFYGPGTGGRHGHVAISAGGGRIRSTDCPSDGRVGETDLAWPTRRWGHDYIGWARNIGGQDIPGAPLPGQQPAQGGVWLEKLRYGQTDSDSVKALQAALNAHRLGPPGNITLPVTGNYLDRTDQVVRACQAQHGYGRDAPKASYVGRRQAEHLGLRILG